MFRFRSVVSAAVRPVAACVAGLGIVAAASAQTITIPTDLSASSLLSKVGTDLGTGLAAFVVAGVALSIVLGFTKMLKSKGRGMGR